MRSTIRRSLTLVAGAALLATMTAATVAAPASAAKPKCAGKTATIVGTAKGEVIRGTRKADVIVARGGNDRIYGRGGNDTICGGAGNDRVVGGGGRDVLLGQNGRDRLYGGPGRDRLLGGQANDYLNGGTGNDACLQGSGSGAWLNCERPAPAVPPPPAPPPPAAADLAVEITVCINCAFSYQNFGVEVRVTNNGPDAVPYVLSHALAPVAGWQVGVDVACETTTDAGGSKPSLAAGEVADFSYGAKCIDLRDTNEAGIEVVFSVQVAHDGSDVPDTNNADSKQFEILYSPPPS